MDASTILLLACLGMGIGGVIGYLIGNSRGNGTLGAMLGLLLGPLGWLIALLLPRVGQRCPECRGFVEPGARKCCHCGSPVTPQAHHANETTELKWYVSRQGNQDGPFTAAQVKALVKSGTLSVGDYATQAGYTEWIRIAEIPGI